MNQPDPAEIEAIASRAEAATPGPWEVTDEDAIGYALAECGDGVHIRVRTVESMADAATDATFIAHARQDIPTLLAALATAEQERDEMRETLRIALEDITAARHRVGLSVRRIERALDPERLTAYFASIGANYHKATGPQAESES